MKGSELSFLLCEVSKLIHILITFRSYSSFLLSANRKVKMGEKKDK